MSAGLFLVDAYVDLWLRSEVISTTENLRAKLPDRASAKAFLAGDLKFFTREL